MNVEKKLEELGLVLPPAPSPAGIYKPVVITNNHLYVSGQPPKREDGTLILGKVGTDLTLEEGILAARQTGLTMLATIKNEIGDLDQIKRLIKSLGMVNCLPGFEKFPKVINGYSQLMADVFGESNGIGARSAVGMLLPGNVAVEIEAIFELND